MLVFISYSHKDTPIALDLCKHIEAWGYRTWIDIHNLVAGEYWPDAVDHALEEADVVAAIMTEASMQSANVKNEWDWALENKKPFCLLRLEPCKISHRYIRINYIDLVSNFHIGLNRLQDALRSPRTQLNDDSMTRDVSRTNSDLKPTRSDSSQRARLLENVRSAWIEGVLEQNLIDDKWLELSANSEPKTIQLASQRMLQNPTLPAYRLSSSQQIHDVFNDLGRELLILGEPGAGKTMSLLELARDLIIHANNDSVAPIPVILNLSSWAEERLAFDQWLTKRLSAEYRVSRRLSRRMINTGQLLLLLDGLDEVQPEYRNACVKAINRFWQDYDFADRGMVVCSRIYDYKLLTENLNLENALVINPLTLEEAEIYLENLGNEWASLRLAIRDNPILREFSTSPLLLNIMAVAYRGLPASQIMSSKDSASQKRHLFDYYITRRLRLDTRDFSQRSTVNSAFNGLIARAAPKEYTQKDTIRYLSWFAHNMLLKGQTVLLLNQITPDWLNAEEDKRLYNRWFRFYRVVSRILAGVIAGAFAGSLTNLLLVKTLSMREDSIFAGFLLAVLLVTLTEIKLFRWTNLISWQINLVFVAFLWGGGHALIYIGAIVFAVALVHNGLFVGALVSMGLILGWYIIAEIQVEGIEPFFSSLLAKIVLALHQRIPLFHNRFLDFAVTQQLLRRVGREYIFRHRMFMEYFAGLNLGS